MQSIKLSKYNHRVKNTCNQTEILFYQLHGYFPEQIYIALLQLGFSDKSFQPIQKEMDRIYTLEKCKTEFQPIENSPF